MGYLLKHETAESALASAGALVVLDDAEVVAEAEKMVAAAAKREAARATEAADALETGELTGTDVAQAKARLGSSRAQLAAAEGQLEISRANYEAVVGRPPGDLAPQPLLDELLPKDVLEALDVARAESPRIQAAELAERASRARVAVVRAQRHPSISLRGGYGYSGQVDPFIADRFARNLSASVVTTVPIYSGGVIASQVRQAVERNNTDRIRLEGVERQVRQVIAQAWSQLRTANVAADANEHLFGEKSELTQFVNAHAADFETALDGDRTGAGTPIKQAERWRSAHAEYNEIMEEILEALVKKNNGTLELFMKDVQCALAGGEGFLFEDDNYSEFVERIQAMDDYECFHRIMCEAAQRARSRHK